MAGPWGEPLSELRRRFVARAEPIAAATRAALRRDPRPGAQRLLAEIERRRAREAGERRRLRRLFQLERRFALAGARRIAGVDEVGVGPLAGPVIAAAVVLPGRCWLPGLRDSKLLSAKARERLEAGIRASARDVAVGIATREEIDRINIYQASLLAMRRAVQALSPAPDQVLVDARRIPDLAVAQQPVPHGDRIVACIAAASIVAKVHRDRLMCQLDGRYPGYGFSSNAGYATAAHLAALAERGPCPIHRRSFAPVRESLRGLDPPPAGA